MVRTPSCKTSLYSLGIGLVAAAEQKVDATPMEGIDPNSSHKLLKLKEKELKNSALLSLGYGDAEKDWLANMKKVRKPKESFY